MKQEKISGIYRIVCVRNGRYYYGSSKNIEFRWNIHKSELNKNCHKNSHLQRAWNKYGEAAFRFELTELISEQNLFDEEQKYLDKHVGKSNCFNVSRRANCPSLYGRDNPSKRLEVRLKLSKAATGRKLSENAKQKLREIGRTRPKYWLGRHHSEKSKLKMSIANRGKIPWNKGLTKETSLKVAEVSESIRQSYIRRQG